LVDGTTVFYPPWSNSVALEVRKSSNGMASVGTGGFASATEFSGLVMGGGKLWWTNRFSPGGSTQRVVRANADGSGAAVFASGTGETVGLASDATDIYWADAVKGRIYKMPLGSAACDMQILPPNPGACVVLTNATLPWNVALDATNVYFTTVGGGTSHVWKIAKNNVGGVATAIATNQAEAQTLATDGTYVYWTNVNDNTLRRVAVGATCAAGACEIVSNVSLPSSVTVDGDAVYFTSNALATNGGGLFLWVK
jgi:hypothetical protein